MNQNGSIYPTQCCLLFDGGGQPFGNGRPYHKTMCISISKCTCPCRMQVWFVKSGQTKPDLLDCLLWPCITRNYSTSVIHNVYDYNYGNTCTRHVQFYGRGRSCSGKAWKQPCHINWTVKACDVLSIHDTHYC